MSESTPVTSSEALPEITPNIIRQWLDDIGSFGPRTHQWYIEKSYFEALCRFAIKATQLSETRESIIEKCALAVEDSGGDNKCIHAEAIRALKYAVLTK